MRAGPTVMAPKAERDGERYAGISLMPILQSPASAPTALTVVQSQLLRGLEKAALRKSSDMGSESQEASDWLASVFSLRRL